MVKEINFCKLTFFAAPTSFAQIHLSGYIRSNVTYTARYYHSSPNYTKADNYTPIGMYIPIHYVLVPKRLAITTIMVVLITHPILVPNTHITHLCLPTKPLILFQTILFQLMLLVIHIYRQQHNLRLPHITVIRIFYECYIQPLTQTRG